ncbi:MAG: hypothetical protein M1833_000165 [Piccolia ochrophora]|nr:MAG: hypothetical protein M1833_000165 [Piccolia ochrophora]
MATRRFWIILDKWEAWLWEINPHEIHLRRPENLEAYQSLGRRPSSSQDKPFLSRAWNLDAEVTCGTPLCYHLPILLSYRGLASSLEERFLDVKRRSAGPDASSWEDMVWSSRDLERVIKTLLSQTEVKGKMVFFVDALDEYEGDHWNMVKLLKSLATSHGHQKLQVKICAASRPYNICNDGFAGYAGCIIHQWTTKDIERYVALRLHELPRVQELDGRHKPGQPITIDELAEEIVGKALGDFLWVRLVVSDLIQGLTDGDSIPEIQRSLAALPADINDLYRNILTKVDEKHLSNTYHYFDITMHAAVPLLLLEFAFAVAPISESLHRPIADMSPSEAIETCRQVARRIGSRCRGLVEVHIPDHVELRGCLLPLDDERDRNYVHSNVTFLHQTFLSYLLPEESRKLASRDSLLSTRTSYLGLVNMSLRVLKIDYVPPETLERSARCFWIYAAKAEESTGDEVADLVEELERTSPRRFERTSFPDRRPGLRFDKPWKTSPLAAAISHGLLTYVKRKVSSEGFDVNAKGGRPLLHYASDCIANNMAERSKEMLRLLLDVAGLKRDWDTRQTLRRPHADYIHHTLQALNVLILNGANLNENFIVSQICLSKQPTTDDTYFYWDYDEKEVCDISPLHALVLHVYPGSIEEVLYSAELMLARGADPTTTAGDGRTILDLARQTNRPLEFCEKFAASMPSPNKEKRRNRLKSLFMGTHGRELSFWSSRANRPIRASAPLPKRGRSTIS